MLKTKDTIEKHAFGSNNCYIILVIHFFIWLLSTTLQLLVKLGLLCARLEDLLFHSLLMYFHIVINLVWCKINSIPINLLKLARANAIESIWKPIKYN